MTAFPRRAWAAYALAILVIVLDQASKQWLLADLRLIPGASWPVWGPLRFTLVANNGISFGFFQSQAPWTRWALAAFSLAVTIGLGIWAKRSEKAFTALTLGLIMGGAVGNLIDRITRGAVVDFVDVQALHFPWIFNLADSAISVGITLLLIESLFTPSPAQGHKA